MQILSFLGWVLFILLIYKIYELKQTPSLVETKVPDKVEAPEPELIEPKLEAIKAEAPELESEVDLELAAFRADLEAFGKDNSKEVIPTGAIFRHPLAYIKVDEMGFGTPNTYAYSSLLINDAYLHPHVSNEQRENARAFIRKVIGEDAFKIMHPKLINRQMMQILETCNLVSTVLENRQLE